MKQYKVIIIYVILMIYQENHLKKNWRNTVWNGSGRKTSLPFP